MEGADVRAGVNSPSFLDEAEAIATSLFFKERKQAVKFSPRCGVDLWLESVLWFPDQYSSQLCRFLLFGGAKHLDTCDFSCCAVYYLSKAVFREGKIESCLWNPLLLVVQSKITLNALYTCVGWGYENKKY